MDYLKNHCWCSNSHWDNKHFDCSIIVTLSSYNEGYVDDWANLTRTVEVFSKERYDTLIQFRERVEKSYTGERIAFEEITKDKAFIKVPKLNEDVLSWLETNIKDYDGGKGWCVGSDEYIATDGKSRISVFFQRRRDAMLFIKTWSKWKKPIHYTQYFTDVRKVLDLDTLKYKVS